jgi:hypothetical protein
MTRLRFQERGRSVLWRSLSGRDLPSTKLKGMLQSGRSVQVEEGASPFGRRRERRIAPAPVEVFLICCADFWG